MKRGDVDWKALERLRAAFLSGDAGERDYWQSESDLASYDQTFAQRIGWKWDYVLSELKRRRWPPPGRAVLDWGCGSGVASRALLDHFGIESVSALGLWDRSPLAMNYAARRVRERFPDLAVVTESGDGFGNLHKALGPLRIPLTRPADTLSPTGEEGRDEGVLFKGCLHEQSQDTPSNPCPAVGTLILSHVLTELKSAQVDSLLALAQSVTAILWVEPGTHAASRALIQIRERLRGQFRVIAPCTHQEGCGMLATENARHWCHHFAPPPPEVFTDGQWSRFAKLAGIDLRSLPLSFLVLDKRPFQPLPDGTVRIIGRPRIQKTHALIFACDSSGVRDRRLMKRALPGEFARLKKGDVDPLQIWKRAGDDILEAKPAA